MDYTEDDFLTDYMSYVALNANQGTDYLNWQIGKPWNQVHKGLRLGPLTTEGTLYLCPSDWSGEVGDNEVFTDTV